MMVFIAWKQGNSRFLKKLDLFRLENSMKFLNFHLLCFILIALSHSIYIIALDFFREGGGGGGEEYLNVPMSEQPHSVSVWRHLSE